MLIIYSITYSKYLKTYLEDKSFTPDSAISVIVINTDFSLILNINLLQLVSVKRSSKIPFNSEMAYAYFIRHVIHILSYLNI